MKKLFIEELESRNLLNAGGFGHQAMPWLEPDRGSSLGFMHADAPLADFGNRTRFDRDPGLSPYGAISPQTVPIIIIFTEIIPSIIPETAASSIHETESAIVPEASIGPAIFPLAPASGQGAGKPLNEITFNFVPVSDSNFLVEASNLPKTVSNLTDLAALSASENGSSANVSAVAGALSAKPGSPKLVRADNSASLGNLRGPSSSLIPDNVRAARDSNAEGDGPILRSEPLQSVPPLAANELPRAPLAKAIRASLAALPQVSDLVNGVAAADLARIEQGISNILQQLDGAEGMALPAATRDLYPWILAGIATAAACEMARAMRKAPKALDLLALQMAPWEIPHEREHG